MAWSERFGLRLHLTMCSICRRYARQLAFLRFAARKLASREIPDARLTEEARDRIRRRLRADLEL